MLQLYTKKASILFEIQMSVASPEHPLFVARVFQGGPFCKPVSTTSMVALEMSWSPQNQVDGDTDIRLSKMKGASFMGLDIPAFTEYLRSKVSSFKGFRSREKERGRSTEDIGSRQQRRLKASLLQDFETALGKVCPQDLGQAFERLQSSQAFNTKFLTDMYYRFAQDDKRT